MAKKVGRPKKVGAVELSTWSIRIPWETRISVQKAVERSKKDLSSWLDEVLLKASREVLTGKQEIAKTENDVIKEMANNLETVKEISHMLTLLAERAKKRYENQPWWKKIIGVD